MSTYNGGYRTGEAQPYEPFTVTIKAGSSMDAPWIIVKADTVVQLRGRLNQLEEIYIPQTVARVAQAFTAAYKHEQEQR